jgi:hypothetical protein
MKLSHSERLSQARGTFRPQVEALEDRLVPAPVAPVLNSNPAAPVALYLDFDRHFEESWAVHDVAGNEFVYDTTHVPGFDLPGIITPAFDLDNDYTTFNQEEKDTITEVWQRVAEDYRPFNVNVTTVEPADPENGKALRVAIGGHPRDWLETDPNKAWSGVSDIGSFVNRSQYVVYVFSERIEEMVATGVKDWDGRLVQLRSALANTVSHEAGHAFGLYHQRQYTPDGTILLNQYNPGSATWTPIMGDNLASDRTTWHDGPINVRWVEDFGAQWINQNNMQVIAAAIDGATNARDDGYRPDDHGNTMPTATPLAAANPRVGGKGPASALQSVTGIIHKTSDVDYFSFHVEGTTQVRFTVDVAPVGPNLDIKLEVRNSRGKVIASADPGDTLGATLEASLQAGDYYLVVGSHGTYGDVGLYTVRGSLTPSANPTDQPRRPGQDGARGSAGGSADPARVAPASPARAAEAAGAAGGAAIHRRSGRSLRSLASARGRPSLGKVRPGPWRERTGLRG